MSQRYEWIEGGSADIELVSPGTHVGEHRTDQHALIVGDPGGCALVVEGTPDQLVLWAQSVLALAKQAGAGQ